MDPQSNTPVTQAFKAFYDNVLSKEHNNPELIKRWGVDPSRFETQIACLKQGTRIDGANNMYTEDGEEFGPQRWPYDSKTNPHYSDPPINYIIANRLKAIGTSWWDWKNKRTVGLGFDFDNLIDHPTEGVGIPQSEIDKLDNMDIDWLEVIRSTRGNGRHIYIWFEEPYPITQNHDEHKAVALSFLPLIARYTGLNIQDNVDCKGLIMWIHHVNATKENRGYELIKPAKQILTAKHVPPNWRDNLEVVSGSRSKVRVQGWTADGTQTEGDELDEMTQSYAKIRLEEAHLQILEDLDQSGYSSFWVGDHHLWQGHTCALKQVYDKRINDGKPLLGLFDTNSPDSDPGKPNCFMRPKPGGGWDVYRFGEGTTECDLWDKQGKWTHTTYNCLPTLRQIVMVCGGFESPKEDQGFVFSTIEDIERALKMLRANFDVPRIVRTSQDRSFFLRTRPDGKIVFTISKERSDKPADFAKYAKTSKGWERLLFDSIDLADTDQMDNEMWSDLDDVVRCLKADKQFEMWVVRDLSEEWVIQPRENVKSVLFSKGLAKPDPIIGTAVLKAWTLVNEPFGPEYPGGRKWNRNSPQFAYQPVELGENESPVHPNWDKLMKHCGVDLDKYVLELPWCKEWGIECGGDYLKAWVACMFRYPYHKLPYLFMYGPQNSGKSSFHEALRFLFVDGKGVENADRALTSKGGYNGELNGVVLAVIDEVDIARAGKETYNKMKDWTTGSTISIHAKFKQPKSVKNTLHFVQTANNRQSLPVDSDDTRITAMYVPSFESQLEEEIPRHTFYELLRGEAEHFMRTLFDWEIPPPTSRLALPVIETQGKKDAQQAAMDPLEAFIVSNCHPVDGYAIKMSEFKIRFYEALEDYQRGDWPISKLKQEIAEKFPVGRGRGNVDVIGNISWTECEPRTPYCKNGDRLVRENDDDN